MTPQEILQAVLENTKPLKYPRGDRLPLLVWPLTSVATRDEAKALDILKQLDARGVPVISVWNPSPKARERSLQQALWLGRLQKKLGLRIFVNANRCMHRFYDDTPATAHVDQDGKPFFDLSFHPNGRLKMGCPFTLEPRIPVIREQFEYFLKAYKAAGLDVAMIFVDWEIDGPQEWCAAWVHSKRCVRCRKHIPDIDDFRSFQAALRKLRSKLQREAYADVVKRYFPHALVGNYAVYPNNGLRYWYDFFEYGKLPEGAPVKTDGRAKYREWYKPEFELTGYTLAMPVVYPWAWTYNWYDFQPGDYRWFYNMLKCGSNAPANNPNRIAIVPFVHWRRIFYPMKPDDRIQPFSERGYKELLWHLLLRGNATLFLWCPAQDTGVEVKPLHEVYAGALQYRDFLDRGRPVCFDVPPAPGPVVSGLRLGDRVLVRRTDFTDAAKPVTLRIDGRPLSVPRLDGKCQILTLPK